MISFRKYGYPAGSSDGYPAAPSDVASNKTDTDLTGADPWYAPYLSSRADTGSTLMRRLGEAVDQVDVDDEGWSVSIDVDSLMKRLNLTDTNNSVPGSNPTQTIPDQDPTHSIMNYSPNRNIMDPAQTHSFTDAVQTSSTMDREPIYSVRDHGPSQGIPYFAPTYPTSRDSSPSPPRGPETTLNSVFPAEKEYRAYHPPERQTFEERTEQLKVQFLKEKIQRFRDKMERIKSLRQD